MVDESEVAKTGSPIPGTPLDTVLEKLDALNARLDSYDEKEKEEKAKADQERKAKADQEAKEKEEEPIREKPGDWDRGDSARQDARTDADSWRPSDQKWLARMAEIQAKCDAVASAFSTSAPRPMNGESRDNYRRRILKPYQRMSDEFAKVDLNKLDGAALDAIENRCYADAMAAARDPQKFALNEVVRRVTRTDESGRRINEFFGDSKAWINQFASPGRYRVIGINRDPDGNRR